VGVGDISTVHDGAWGSRLSAIVLTAGERGGTGSIGELMDTVVISMTRRSNGTGSGLASVIVHGAGLGLPAFTATGQVQRL